MDVVLSLPWSDPNDDGHRGGGNDRVVLRYHDSEDVPADRRVASIVAFDAAQEMYVHLARTGLKYVGDDKPWTLMWRGDWKSVLRNFLDYIGDVEMEHASFETVATALDQAEEQPGKAIWTSDKSYIIQEERPSK